MGGTPLRRRLLDPICRALHSAKRSSQRLLEVEPAEYVKLFHCSRAEAKLPAAHLHQIRHGGASADALEDAGDLSIASRGRWASLTSVRRYRKPAVYLRQLHLLTAQQRNQAATSGDFIVRSICSQLRKVR